MKKIKETRGCLFFENMLEKLQVKSCPRHCSLMKCLCWILSSFSTGSKQRASCRVLANQCGKKVVPLKDKVICTQRNKQRFSYFYTWYWLDFWTCNTDKIVHVNKWKCTQVWAKWQTGINFINHHGPSRPLWTQFISIWF